MHLQFRSFDSMVYELAKAKDKANEKRANDGKTASSTKSIHIKRGTIKSSTRTTSTASMTVGEELPPTQTLPLMDVYDLTAEEEPLVQLPNSTCKRATQVSQEQATHGQAAQEQASQGQVTQGQAIRETEDGNIQDRETVTNEASVEHIKEDLRRDSGEESVDDVFAYCPISSAQSSNGMAGLSTEAASNAPSICWESGGTQTAGVPRCSNAFSQDVLELLSDESSHLCGQAADGHESVRSNRGVFSGLSMDNADDDSTLSDEWEGKIIGEEADGYLVAWKNSFISKENAGEAMIRAWEENKAKILAGRGKRGRDIGLKQPAIMNGRVEKREAGKRGRGRQRV